VCGLTVAAVEPEVAQRIVIDLHRGRGPISGWFLAEGQVAAIEFLSWMDLVALLEAARRPQAVRPMNEGDRSDGASAAGPRDSWTALHSEKADGRTSSDQERPC
jgi:hypothetical protein